MAYRYPFVRGGTIWALPYNYILEGWQSANAKMNEDVNVRSCFDLPVLAKVVEVKTKSGSVKVNGVVERVYMTSGKGNSNDMVTDRDSVRAGDLSSLLLTSEEYRSWSAYSL